MAKQMEIGIVLKADGRGLVGEIKLAENQFKSLAEAGIKAGEQSSVGVRKLIDSFAASKRGAAGLEAQFHSTTSAVTTAAAKLKASPGDATLAREFERLKQAAQTAKAELVSGQAVTEAARRGLAAQGVSVANLAADYRKLKAAQEASRLNSISSTNSTNGSTTISPRVQPSVHQDGSVNQQLDGVSGRIGEISTRLARMGHLATAYFAAQQILPYIAGLGHLSDRYTSLNAQLKLGVGASGNFAQAQAEVLRIATASATGLAETAQLYARLNSSVTRLGFDQRQVANVTETVGLALKVSGATAAESSSAILQLSQAFGSGVLRGEEFNAVNEAAPRLMQALADAIGRPKEQLRGLAEQGLLTSKLLALNLPAALGTLRAEAAFMPLTIGQSFTLLNNKATLLIGKINEGTGIFSGFAAGVRLLADNMVVALTLAGTAGAAVLVKIAQGIAARRAIERAAHIAALAEIAERTAAESLANKAALSGLARLGAAHTATAATSVAAMGRTGLAARGLLSALTGPVGIVVGIGLAAAAWIGFKEQSVSALDVAIAKAEELARAQAKTGIKTKGTEQGVTELAQFEKDLVAAKQALADKKKSPGFVFDQNSWLKEIAALQLTVTQGEAIIAATRAKLKTQAAEDRKQEAARLAANAALLAANGKDQPGKKPKADNSAAIALAEQQDYMAAIGKTTQSLIDEAAAAELSNSLIGKSAEQLALATEARYNEQIAQKAAELFSAQQSASRQAEVDLLEMQISALARLRDAESARPVLQANEAKKAADNKATEDAAKQAAAEFDKRGEMISQTLSDALMRGFESGKGLAQNFGDTVKNIFKTLVLEPRIKASVQPLADALNRIIDNFAKGLADAMSQNSAGGTSLMSGIGDWFKGLFNANGNAFGSQGVQAFANGGSFSNSIVSQPTPFTFGGGKLGVMGEAGDEAVMPLTRTAGGKLGVHAQISAVSGVAGSTDAMQWNRGAALQAANDHTGWQALATGMMGIASALTLGLSNVSSAYADIGGQIAGARPADAGTIVLSVRDNSVRAQGALLQPASAGGVNRPNISIVVQNSAAGVQVTPQLQQGPNGDVQVAILVEQIEQRIAGNVSRGVGQLAPAMESTYGLNRAAGAYR